MQTEAKQIWEGTLNGFWTDALSNFLAGIASGAFLSLVPAMIGRRGASGESGAFIEAPQVDGVSIHTGNNSPATLTVEAPRITYHNETHLNVKEPKESKVVKAQDSNLEPVAILVVSLVGVFLVCYLYLRFQSEILLGVITVVSAVFAFIFISLAYAARHGINYRRQARQQIALTMLAAGVVAISVGLIVYSGREGTTVALAERARSVPFAEFMGLAKLDFAFATVYRLLGLTSALALTTFAVRAGLGLVGTVKVASARARGKTELGLWRTLSTIAPKMGGYVASIIILGAISIGLSSGAAYKGLSHLQGQAIFPKSPTAITLQLNRKKAYLSLCADLTSGGSGVANRQIRFETWKDGSWSKTSDDKLTNSAGRACAKMAGKKPSGRQMRATFAGDEALEKSASRSYKDK